MLGDNKIAQVLSRNGFREYIMVGRQCGKSREKKRNPPEGGLEDH
jgi:hypothetical protein